MAVLAEGRLERHAPRNNGYNRTRAGPVAMPNRTTTALALALLCVGGAILILAERRQRPAASHGGADRAAQDGGLDKTVAPRLHGDTPANSGSNGPRDEAPVPTIAAYWRGLLDQALAMPAEGGLSREDPLFPREERLRAIQHMDPVDEASVLSLIGALADIDVSVNQVAESAVEGHERVLLPLLCSTYHELRGNVYGLKRNIAGVLAKYAAEDEAAMTVVELAAVDDDAAIRYAAVDGVARAEPSEETNHILVSALVDSRSFVRTSAALALARQGDQRGIDEVFGLYRRGDPDYRCWLLKALAKQPSFEPWHEIFASSLGDLSHGTPAFRHAEPTEVRWIAAGVLIGIGGDEVRSFLRGIADGVSADARLAVSVCLSSLGASLDSCGADWQPCSPVLPRIQQSCAWRCGLRPVAWATRGCVRP